MHIIVYNPQQQETSSYYFHFEENKKSRSKGTFPESSCWKWQSHNTARDLTDSKHKLVLMRITLLLTNPTPLPKVPTVLSAQHCQSLPTPRMPGSSSQLCCLHTPGLVNEVAPCQARSSEQSARPPQPSPCRPLTLRLSNARLEGGPVFTLLSVSFPTSPWHRWAPASLERTTLSVTFIYDTPEGQ